MEIKISKHISIKEATRSNTAERLGIDNFPDSPTLVNMQALAENVFEPLREHFGHPIYITSFYRSPELNKAIGGSSKSQHCLGQAIDIDDVIGSTNNSEFFHYIKDNLEFDQLIWEFGNGDNPNWVHVSYSTDNNRGNILKAIKENGKTKYTIWNQ